MSINHLISLKLYTDFNDIQREFKLNCRFNDENETLSELVIRNSEIGHWCRYVFESCSFFGNLLHIQKSESKIVYCGLKKKLIFNSMTQRFECMLSTSKSSNIASNFGRDEGIVLQLKAANTKTRYFDCSFLSHYEQEWERLCMGSSLKICNIYINGKSSKKYIIAIQLFEQIINGKFIIDEYILCIANQQILYKLIKWVLNNYNGNNQIIITNLQL
eukprot:431331_1